jgi:hypothetical protein
MMAAVVVFLLAISSGDAPDMTALAGYDSMAACETAAAAVNAALAGGEDARMVLCVSADTLQQMVKQNLPAGD